MMTSYKARDIQPKGNVRGLCGKERFYGHTVNFKTRKHFKDKKSHYVDKDQWLIFENTHAPIIDQETFDNVQRIRGQVRRYPDGWGEAHPLTGLDVLRRLRWQNVCPQGKQRKTCSHV